MDSLILTEVVGGLGVITLNRPQALNALSLAMVRDLTAVLRGWAVDDKVHAVLMRGSARPSVDGKRAAVHFCAGGDIRFFHDAAVAGHVELDDFFNEEYALDHLIHRYPKPTVAWLEGVVMGGGMGLAQGCRLRVATETVRMAMPETRIGLFPDVAGGYFLSRCMGSVGEYLAMVGAHLHATDALDLGLANAHAVASSLGVLMDGLRAQPAANGDALFKRVQSHVVQHGLRTMPDAVVTTHLDQINHHFGQHALQDMVASLQSDDSDWARQTSQHMAGNSPLMMGVAFEQVRRARNMPLADELRMERTMMRHAFTWRSGPASEAVEGIRALVVDKDQRPRWQPASLADVTPAMVDAFFGPIWPVAAHPLRDLQDRV